MDNSTHSAFLISKGIVAGLALSLCALVLIPIITPTISLIPVLPLITIS